MLSRGVVCLALSGPGRTLADRFPQVAAGRRRSLPLCAALALTALIAVLAERPAEAAETRYSLSGECFVLRSEATDRLVVTAGNGYRANAAAAGDAEPFRMQATDLGEYLFYGSDRDFLARGSDLLVGPRAESAGEPSPAADWRVEETDTGGFRISLRSDGQVLAVAADGDELVVEGPGFTGPRSVFSFEPAEGCLLYPEIGTQASGTPFSGATPYGEVRGLLDSHLHLGAFEFLGGAHCGRPWHRYGAPFALVDCPDHEPNGVGAALENLLSGNPAGTHDTTGWPTFQDWPDHDSLTHEQTYYKWIERAWRGGLRLVVNDLVENRGLCEIYPPTNDLARGKQETCDEMESARLQLRRLHELEDYIDAQEGGPGEGWFRIVESPFEARRVINEGKLAVVMGMETSELFGCGISPRGPSCDKADIVRQLDQFHNLGVRSLFPVHKFDNGLGGTRMDSGQTGAAVNAGNFYATGRFWDVETCTGSQQDNEQSTAVPGEAGLIGGAFDFFDPLPPGTQPPVYPPPPHCNTRGLTNLGEFLVRQMIQRGMIVEPDHLSVRAQNRVMAILESNDYSGVIGSHTWSDPAAWPRIYELGGIVTPITQESPEFVDEWQELRSVRSDRFYFGMGFGADSNGLHEQPPPRDGASANPVTYPFQSFDGGVTLDRQQSGERVWDVNVDGVDHYGLHPDWVEDLRLVGGEQIVSDLGRGAEAYLQMWERAEGVPGPSCRPAKGRFENGGLDELRLGDSPTDVLVRAGQPEHRTDRSYRYCVAGAGNEGSTLGAAFTEGGSLGLVATDAAGYSAGGVSPGDPAGRLSRTSPLGDGLHVRRNRDGTAFVYEVRGDVVRAVGVADSSVAETAERLRQHLNFAL